MALNLNVYPYYDDFDPTNNYNRILFKPGVSVQARELTQIQTILQDQISNISSFTLKEGAVISGCEEFRSIVPWIKVNDLDANSNTVLNSTLPNFIGETIEGSTTGLKAIIRDVKTGDVSSGEDKKTFYLQYIDGGGATNVNYEQHFSAGETLTVTSPGEWKGRTFIVNSVVSTVSNRYWGHAHRIQLSPGIIYARGQFIRTEKIGCYVDRYSAAVRRQIGFNVEESIITASEDPSLTDPAQGTYNQNSPGADRYKLSVTLESYPLNAETPNNFYRYATFEYGQYINHKIKNDPLSDLGDHIARRAYEANGDYVIDGFYVKVREHLNDGNNGGRVSLADGGDPSLLIAEVSPGKCNVGGYLHVLENIKQIPFSKPITTKKTDQAPLTTVYANYVVVDELAGCWDFSTVSGSDDGIVDLYDSAQGALTGSKSATTVTGNKIGEAKVKQIEYVSGTPGTSAAQYRLYLFDIKMIGGNAFDDVLGFYYTNTTASTTTNGFADVASAATLVESTNNKMLWRLPKRFTKTLQTEAGVNNYEFEYLKQTTASCSTGTSTFSIAAGTDESFTFWNDTANYNNNLIVVATSTFTANSVSYVPGQIVNAEAILGTGHTSTSLKFDLGGNPNNTANFKVYVKTLIVNQDPINKVASKGYNIKIDVANHPNYDSGEYSLGVPDVYKLNSVTAYTSSDFSTGALDVTDQFRLATNQKDNFYDLSFISKKGSSTLDLTTYKYLTVNFDYFSRSGSPVVSFASVDSYPIPSTETAAPTASQIYIQEIPIYSSPKLGVFDLRDCVDFRPYVADTATGSMISTTAASVTTYNPSNIGILEYTQYTNPTPDGVFKTDIYNYLPQSYRCSIDHNGQISIDASPASEKVAVPANDTLKMTLATFVAPPHPCLSSKAAQYFNRPDLALKVSNMENPHYTMRDIGKLERRITNIEYYTTLSMLEKEARDKQILDSNGDERFKNGLMVDSFRGHSTSASNHPDFKASIDYEKQNLRAYFNESTIDFRAIDNSTSSSAGQTGKLFHVPYVETVYAEQLQASQATPIVIELLYDTTDPVGDAVNTALAAAASAAQAAANAQNSANAALNTAAQNAAKIAAVAVGLEDIETAIDQLPPPTSETIIITQYLPAEPSVDVAQTVEEVIQEPTAAETTTTTTVVVEETPINDPDPVYRLIRDKSKVDEGSSFTISVETYNHRAGNTVNYVITGVSSADLNGASLTGTITLSSAGSGYVTFNVAEDLSTGEGEETVTFTLTSTDGYGYPTGSKSTTVVLNDTSRLQEEPPRPICGPGYVWDESTQSCVPAEKPSWNKAGYMSISPSEDCWQSFDTAEKVLEDVEGEYTQFDYPEPWNVTWAGWVVTNEYVVDDVKTYDERTGQRVETEYFVNERMYAEAYDYSEEGYWQYTIDTYDTYQEVTSNKMEEGYYTVPTYNGILPGPIQRSKNEITTIPSIVAYARPIAIDYNVEGLIPNTYHNVQIGGIPKGGVTTDHLGRAIGTITIGENELEVGTHEIVVAATGNNQTYKDINSYASAFFVSQHEGTQVTTTYKWNIVPPTTTTGLRSGSQTKIVSTNTVTSKVSSYEVIVDEVMTITSAPINPRLTPITTRTETVDTAPIVTAVNNNNTPSSEVLITNVVSGSNPAHLVNSVNEHFSNVYMTTVNTSAQAKVADPSTNFTDTSAGEVAPVENTVYTDIEIEYDLTAEADYIKAQIAALGETMVYNMYNMYCPNGWDPMAQTFLVEGMQGGMYLSSVDLFFKKISKEKNNNGITLELREVINGMPGPTALGKVYKRRNECRISSSSSAGAVTFETTQFKFPTPIYLENDTEYCIIPIPDRADPDYEIWIAELGQNEIGTSRVISKQAASGVLFTSANNRSWTPHQNQDMMFRLNRCYFRTGREFTVTMKNKNTDWITFEESTEFAPGTFVYGITTDVSKITSTHDTSGTGLTVNLDSLSTAAGLTMTADTDASGNVTALNITSLGNADIIKTPTITSIGTTGTYTQSANPIKLNRGRVARYSTKYGHHEIEVIQGSFDNVDDDTITDGDNEVTISTIHDRIVDAYVLRSRVINPGSYGTITPKLALTSSTASVRNTTTEEILINKTTELNTPCKVYSYSNTLNSTYGETATVEFVMKTEVNNLSPMVNVEGTSMLMIHNEINNDSSGEEVATGGTASSRYITKKVILSEGLDAEDLKVWLDNKKGAGDVEVYAKLQNKADDSADFLEDIYWKKLELESQPANTSTTGWGEYVYTLPDKGSSNIGINGSGQLEYDVKSISSLTITNGGTGYAVDDVIRFTGGNGRKGTARITSVDGSGVITGVEVTNPGRYQGTPTVSVVTSSGSSAVLTPVMNTTTFVGFKTWAIKIVHLSSNTAKVPKSANLRAYALPAYI